MNEWIVPVAVAVIAALPGIFALRGQFRKESADAAASYHEMLDKEIDKRREYMAECKEQAEQIELLEREIERLSRYIGKLKAYITLIDGEIPPSEDTRPR